MNISKHYYLIIFFSFILFSCANKPLKVGRTDAEILYKSALEAIERERFLLATEQLNLVRSQHPYSYYSIHAELLQAKILYLQENYVEAAAAYILFKDLHPKNKKMPSILSKIAESYFRQLPKTYDRDLSLCSQVIAYDQKLITSYPEYKKIKVSHGRIEKCHRMTMEKNRSIADFYFTNKNYFSAAYRYREIIEESKDRKLLDHAMVYLIKSLFYLKNKKECLKFFNILTKQKISSIEQTLPDCEQLTDGEEG